MTSNLQLRQMTVRDLVDTAFKLYRQHFLTFFGITVLLQVPLIIIQLIVYGQFAGTLQSLMSGSLTRTPLYSANTIWALASYYLAVIAVSILQYLICYNLINGTIAHAIAQYTHGEQISILGAYRLSLRRLGTLIVASLLPLMLSLFATVLVIGGGFGIVTWITSQRGSMATIIIAALVFLLVVVLFALGMLLITVRLLFIPQMVMLEKRGPLDAIQRSWQLVSQHFWRTLGIVVLVAILAMIIAFIIQLPVTLILMLTRVMWYNFALYQSISLLSSQTIQMLLLPFQLSMFTLLYYDLRIRKEGYDLEVMAQQAAAL